MGSVARFGDVCTGHEGFPPRHAISASDDVRINSIGVVRLSDSWELHSDGDSQHDSTLASGSSTVFVNGLPIGRVGDNIECGSMVATGSDNVFAGD